MNRTGVVIVTYNSAEVIERCLASCSELPVVVVDNASHDQTKELVRRHAAVKLIANEGNRGFGGAANQGAEALDTELILLLNPDVQLTNSVAPLEDACAREGYAMAGGKLVDKDGRAQQGFTLRRFPTPWTLAFEVLGINRILPPNPVNRRYRCLDVDLAKPGDADQPPGAFLMFRREVWQRLGGFDTQFHPIWFEDVDFEKRARDLGLRIAYVPQVVARHQGGHSIAGLNWGCREVCWYASLLRYACKHFRPYAYRGVSTAVMLGSLIRAVAGMIRWRSVGPIKVYAKVVRIAGQCFVSGRVPAPECLGG